MDMVATLQNKSEHMPAVSEDLQIRVPRGVSSVLSWMLCGSRKRPQGLNMKVNFFHWPVRISYFTSRNCWMKMMTRLEKKLSAFYMRTYCVYVANRCGYFRGLGNFWLPTGYTILYDDHCKFNVWINSTTNVPYRNIKFGLKVRKVAKRDDPGKQVTMKLCLLVL